MVRLMKGDVLTTAITSKKVLYYKVFENVGVPKPTNRRVARELRNDYEAFLNILSADIPTTPNY